MLQDTPCYTIGCPDSDVSSANAALTRTGGAKEALLLLLKDRGSPIIYFCTQAAQDAWQGSGSETQGRIGVMHAHLAASAL